MEALDFEPMEFDKSVLIDGGINELLFSILVNKDLKPEKFYLTGFETVCFNKDNYFAIETVLTSTLEFDSEVIILQSGDKNNRLKSICETRAINYQMIDLNQVLPNPDYIELLLKSNHWITHLLMSEDDMKLFSSQEMKRIGEIVKKYKINFIYICSAMPLSLEKLVNFGVSYMIFYGSETEQKSYVVAQRSKLVQAEGKSRSRFFDLYGFWQYTLQQRKHIIEPMAV